MMKVQVADSWQTQLRRRFQCNLQSMATCTQQLHLYCRLLQEIGYFLFLTDDTGDFTDKEIFYIVDCHDVTLLLKSEAGFKLRFIRFWFILWFRVNISWVRLIFHLLTSLLAAAMAVKRWKFWKWLASKQLLQSVDHKYRRRESSTVLTRSGLRSCWKNEAVSSKVLDPSSFRRSSCTNSRLSASTREGLAGILSLLPGKQPSIWKTGHHLQKNNNTVLLFLLILIERMIYGLQYN